MDITALFIFVFLVSLLGVFVLRSRRPKKDEVGAQFVLTGTLLLIFYIVCFFSGICTILNFVFKYLI